LIDNGNFLEFLLWEEGLEKKIVDLVFPLSRFFRRNLENSFIILSKLSEHKPELRRKCMDHHKEKTDSEALSHRK
jgi:hypothetical protein